MSGEDHYFGEAVRASVDAEVTAAGGDAYFDEAGAPSSESVNARVIAKGKAAATGESGADQAVIKDDYRDDAR